jgi:hypothetical protein
LRRFSKYLGRAAALEAKAAAQGLTLKAWLKMLAGEMCS